jgi:hypothetical protein
MASIKLIGNIYNENSGTGYAGCVWDINYLSPTLNTMAGGNRQPLILIKCNERNRKIYSSNAWKKS